MKCKEGFCLSEEMSVIYTDLGRQMMILDIGAPLSMAGVLWIMQYLREFDLTIYEMKTKACDQVFKFGPSRRNISMSLIELLQIVTRIDGREDVLKVYTYLVDVEVLFLCGKRELELWNFKKDGKG